jgi:hypothetical protein
MCAWLCIIMLCAGLLKRNFQYVDLFSFSTGKRGARDEQEGFWPECLTLALRVKTLVGAGIVGRQEPSFNRREGSKWLKVEGKKRTNPRP